MNSIMARKTLIAFAALVALAPPALVARAADVQTETLAGFVKQNWKIQDFQLNRASVLSTAPLRVSTYSSPWFIHRGQLEALGSTAQDLAALCGRQSGTWSYLGLPLSKADRAKPLRQGSALDEAAQKAPATEAGMRDLVKAGEQGVADDVARAFVAALARAPDPLVSDALEYAVRMKWLGRFECARDTSAWTAGISFSKWTARTEKSYVYRDVTLKVELAESN